MKVTKVGHHSFVDYTDPLGNTEYILEPKDEDCHDYVCFDVQWVCNPIPELNKEEVFIYIVACVDSESGGFDDLLSNGLVYSHDAGYLIKEMTGHLQSYIKEFVNKCSDWYAVNDIELKDGEIERVSNELYELAISKYQAQFVNSLMTDAYFCEEVLDNTITAPQQAGWLVEAYLRDCPNQEKRDLFIKALKSLIAYDSAAVARHTPNISKEQYFKRLKH